MIRLSEKSRFKILFLLGGLTIFFIIFILIFDFENNQESTHDKIGFIILGDIQEAGWNASHYNGIKEACNQLRLELIYRDNVKENSGQCPLAIEELIAQGAGMIFLASFAYPDEVKDFVKKYPKISFATNSTKGYTRNMTSHFVRMYEGRYLCGALAGMRTKSNVIGYVAAIPTAEVNRGINAFTLGVQRVNPNAKVVVMWTGDWQDEKVEAAHTERLIKEVGADVLTYHQDEATTADVAEKFGVDFIGYNSLLEGYSDHCLTSQLCRWDIFYQDVIKRHLKGELNVIKNHWVGIQNNVIVLSDYSDLVTPEMRERISFLRQELMSGMLIFSDEIYDNQGNLRCEKKEAISDDALLEIDWLIKGVEVIE